MSNVLKSKVLLGAMIVLAAVVGAMFIATTANAYTHSVTLKMGSTGSQVMELQKALNAAGFAVSSSGAGAPGMESTYFGAKTHGAVVAYQTAKGLGKDGIVGPMTGASLASVVDNDNDNDNDNNNDSDLQGGAGSVESYTLLSGLSNEEVGEDEEDVQVAGLEIEADDGSDLEVTAVKLVFNEGTAGSDFEDYASEVSVWFDGEEVARVDGDEFNDDNNWTKTVSIDSGAVVDAGETAELVVAVSGVSNLDSGDAGDTWDVDFRSVRFVDAQNASTTEDPGVAVRTFSFESFASATDVELKIATGDEDIWEAHVINVDASDDTDNVAIHSFTIEAEGDSDLLIDSLPVTVTSTEATGDDPADLVSAYYLYADGEEIGSETSVDAGADSSEVVVFDDLDYTIEAGDEIEFEVRADFNSIADSLDAGDLIAVAFGETETDLATFDVEDESGEDLVDADKTGTATGESHEVRDIGIMVELVGTPTATKSHSGDPATVGDSDEGTFVITFKVTAFDGDAYIDLTAPDASGGATESDLDVTGTGTVLATISSPTGATQGTDGFLVDEGESENFSITTNIVATADGFFRVNLGSILYALTDVDGDIVYTFNLDDYKTPDLYLNDN